MQTLTTIHSRSDLHIARKLWHSGVGGLVVWAYYKFDNLSYDFWIYLSLSLALAGFTFDFTRFRIKAVNNFFVKYFSVIMRESERNSFSGFPFYALGIGISLYLFEPVIALLSVFFLVFSDPISSLVGIQFGRDKILPNKSLQGSLAGFTTCYLITLIYGLVYTDPSANLFIFALIAGVIGSLSELCSVWVDDNLTIPVLSGLGLTILNHLLPIF